MSEVTFREWWAAHDYVHDVLGVSSVLAGAWADEILAQADRETAQRRATDYEAFRNWVASSYPERLNEVPRRAPEVQ